MLLCSNYSCYCRWPQVYPKETTSRNPDVTNATPRTEMDKIERKSESKRKTESNGYLGIACERFGDSAREKKLLEKALTIEERAYGTEYAEMAIT